MSEIISYIGVVLISTLIIGSLAMVVYFVVCKITKREFYKRTVLKLYLVNLVIWGGICALALLFSKTSKDPIVGFVSILAVIGIILIFARSGKGKAGKRVVRGLKETKCTCQACGNVWYYGKGEYLENKGQRMINSANRHGNAANDLLCCAGCWPAAFLPKNQEIPVKDLNKCPKCNSSAVKKEEVIHDLSK